LLKDGAATMTTDTSSVSEGMMDDDDVMEEDQEQEDGELWTMGESFWCSLCDDGGNLLLYVAQLLIIVIANFKSRISSAACRTEEEEYCRLRGFARVWTSGFCNRHLDSYVEMMRIFPAWVSRP
jgi:hypothetical protein